MTWHTLRHTYAAARLQMYAGAPVSPYTVMKKLGHGSLKLIEETYRHLMESRHRNLVVEFCEAEVISIERGAVDTSNCLITEAVTEKGMTKEGDQITDCKYNT